MLDDRIAAGMNDQLAGREQRLRAGDRPLGWKVGFGSAAAMAKLGTDRPLVGYLLEAGLLPDGAVVSLDGWTTPMLEPEIAVYVSRTVDPAAGREAVQDSIGGLSAAIELADVAPPPSDVREILAGNIFHRHVQLGPVRPVLRVPSARVTQDGVEVAATDDVSALVGDLVDVVHLTAQLLGECGEQLRAGDVVITGSVVPPVPVRPGQAVEIDLDGLGRLSVSFSP
jgi:2-keto-4-pentenoate hydratase